MDLRHSPYAPGAGTRPEVIAGREHERERFAVLLDRLGSGRSAEALLFAGSRGMGKTVLLRDCERSAQAAGWFTSFEEVDARLPLRQVMALCARDVLLEMRATTRFEQRMKNAFGVLRSFSIGVLGVSLGIDVEPVAGAADSGILKRDLLALFREIGEAAASDGAGVVFFLDELHVLRGGEEMEALDAVIHGLAQARLPVTTVGAGVFAGPGFSDANDPRSPSSYAGRLYRVVRLRPLPADQAARALTEPAEAVGISWDGDAVALAVEFAEGLPYLLQMLGEEAWAAAAKPPIDVAAMRVAIAAVTERIDAEFYPRLLGGLPPAALALIAALAAGPASVSTLAQRARLEAGEARWALRELVRRDVAGVAVDGESTYGLTTRGIAAHMRRGGLLEP